MGVGLFRFANKVAMNKLNLRDGFVELLEILFSMPAKTIWNGDGRDISNEHAVT